MSINKGTTKFREEESSVNLIENRSKIYIQPHFAKHTESSLRKRKMLIKSNKNLTTSKGTKLEKVQDLAFSRSNGISKKQSKIVKQNRRSIQTLKTILKQEKQCRISGSFQDNKLMETVCQSKQYMENLLVSFQGDMIKYVSFDPKKCVENLAKSQALQDEMSSIRSLSLCSQDDSKSISNCSTDLTVVNITCELQSQLNDDEENIANSCCKIEVLHRRSKFKNSTESIEPTESTETTEPTEPIEPTEYTETMETTEYIKPIEPIESIETTEIIETANLTEPTADPAEPAEPAENIEDCSKIEEQMFQQNMSINLNAATNCRTTQKTLINEKIEVQNEPNLQLARNSKFTKHIDYSRNKDIRPIINSDVMFGRKKDVQKNFAFTKTQRAWRPPGIVLNSSHIENIYKIPSMQATLRKPYRSTKKYVPPTKDKYASIEYAESFDSKLSASILINQSKEMKENRDPCVNHMTKICKSLIELKQRQKLQRDAEGIFRRKKSANKEDSKILKTYKPEENPKRSRSESESRSWQTRLITPTRSSKIWNDIEQHHSDSNQIVKKSSEVIHALKSIIKNINEHGDENVASISKDGILNHEEIEFPTLPNKKTFSKITRKNNLRFTKNKNLNEVNKSYKSVSTQTELNPFLHLKIDSKNNLDSKEILKSTKTVVTQTSPYRNKNIVDFGCNTVCNVTCKNVGVFCDLIDFTKMKAKIDSTAIQNKSVSENVLIQTNESLSTEFVEINIGKECLNDTETFLPDERTLTTEINSKLEEDYVDMKNGAQCEDMIVSELKVENIPQVIVDLELTTEHVRNLYEAVIIYRSLISKKCKRRQRKYALEIWNGNLEMNRRSKALVVPMTTEKISIISRENLLPFIYCVLCILLFWCLQFSFKYDSIM